MKEDKKHLYRIDPLKVQQKVYEMYPENSEVRKLMLKEQKMKEYGQLSRTIASFPIDVAKATIEHSQTHMIEFMSKFLFFGGMGILTSLLIPQPLILQSVIAGLGSVTFLFLAMKNAIEALNIGRTILNFQKSFKRAQERMDKLKKDIFE